MKRVIGLGCLFALLALSACGDSDSDSGLGAGSAEREVIDQAFAAKGRVDISTVSGECRVEVGQDDSIRVHLEYAYDPPGAFRAELRQEGGKVVLAENMQGSSSGYSTWTVIVPAETEIDFSSVSGDFEAAGLRSQVEVGSVSGNIDLEDISGDVSAESVSGNIEADGLSGNIVLQSVSGRVVSDRLRGALVASSVSGSVDVAGFRSEGAGLFSSVSGDVHVDLAESVQHDLTLLSVSGDAVLDFDGNPVGGSFEFTAKVDKGRIVSPFAFEREEEFTQNGDRYWRKSFARDGDSPKVVIGTVSGRAELKQ